MTLIEKLEAKRRELDRVVVRSINGAYDYRAAEMRDLLDEVLASIHPPLMLMGENLSDDLYEQFRTIGYVVHRRD